MPRPIRLTSLGNATVPAERLSANLTNGSGPERPAQREPSKLATKDTKRAGKNAGAFRALLVFFVAKQTEPPLARSLGGQPRSRGS